MIYFIDAEFLDGPQKKFFGKTKPTIDLISLGMVDITGREFYAISKEFNIKEAWNRFQDYTFPELAGINKKHYWIREKVLYPIFKELIQKELDASYQMERILGHGYEVNRDFTFKRFKYLINKYGQRNIDIANGICEFIYGHDCGGSGMGPLEMAMKYEINDKSLEPEFYGYFSASDWTVFCWIFGTMMTLPKGFPRHCIDLKTMLDQKSEAQWNTKEDKECRGNRLTLFKQKEGYPKKVNEHNALADAKWNLQLYNFLQSI